MEALQQVLVNLWAKDVLRIVLEFGKEIEEGKAAFQAPLGTSLCLSPFHSAPASQDISAACRTLFSVLRDTAEKRGAFHKTARLQRRF